MSLSSSIRRMAISGVAILGLISPFAAFADFVGGGLILQVSSGNGYYALYLSEPTAGGCPAGWYYSYRSDFATPDDYKQSFAAALTAYAVAKRVHVFGGTADCSTKRFNAVGIQP